MAKNYSYWRGTRETLDVIQNECYQDLIADPDYSSEKYIKNTKAVARVWKPEDNSFYVMRVPDEVIKKKPLSDKMKTRNNNIKIVKFKQSWHKVFEEDGV